MTMVRINCLWQSWPGAPGVTTFFSNPTILQSRIDAVRTFWDSIKGGLPSGLVIKVPSVGDTVEQADGSISGTWNVATTPADVTGTGAGAYPGNAGACIDWLTAGIVAGRRVRGRSFIVPVIGSFFDTAGSISTTYLATLSSAASTLVTAFAGDMVIWSRPRGPAGAPPVTPGTSHPITSVLVPDLAVSLRSRRT